jgi:hypothetical protein
MASATVHGYMSSNDWATFNAKQAALGYTPATNSLSGISNAQGFQSVAPTDSRQLTFTSAANDLHGNLSGTNASLTNIYIGGVLVFEQTTNIVTFSGAGNLTNNVDHSWNASLGVHTNEQFHSIVTFQNPTFYLRTADGVNQYSAASLLGPWSAVFGATNAPTSKYGYNFRLTGGQLIGLLSATNLADQIRTYAIPMPTNSGVDGLFASYSGGKTKWAQPQIDTSTATNVNENAFRFTFQKGSILNTNAFFYQRRSQCADERQRRNRPVPCRWNRNLGGIGGFRSGVVYQKRHSIRRQWLARPMARLKLLRPDQHGLSGRGQPFLDQLSLQLDSFCDHAHARQFFLHALHQRAAHWNAGHPLGRQCPRGADRSLSDDHRGQRVQASDARLGHLRIDQWHRCR